MDCRVLGSDPRTPGNDRRNTHASFHKMPTGATPLIIPLIGTVYQVVAPVAEALLRAAVGLGLRLFYGFFPGTGVKLGSFAAFSAMLDRGLYRPAKLWAVLVFITEFVAGGDRRPLFPCERRPFPVAAALR